MVAKTKKKKKSRRSRRRRVQLTRATTLSQESHLSRAQSEGLNLSAGFIRLIYLRILFLLAALFFFSPFSRARPRRGEARRVESSGEASECRVTSRPINDGEAGKRNGSDGADSTMEAAVFHSCARFRLAFPEKLFTKYYLSS